MKLCLVARFWTIEYLERPLSCVKSSIGRLQHKLPVESSEILPTLGIQGCRYLANYYCGKLHPIYCLA